MKSYKELHDLDEAVNAPFIKNATKAIDQAIKSLSRVKTAGDIVDELRDIQDELKDIK